MKRYELDEYQKKPLTIVVGTNSLTESQYPAYTNHCQFWFRLGRSYPNYTFVFNNPSRTSIDRMRNATAKAAIAMNADYILFLDDDVIVPPNDGLKKLLECKADIAAGSVVIRGYPFDYMIFQRMKKAGGDIVPIKQIRRGIRDCEAVGFSFALIKVSALKKMKGPWFVTGIHNTEDVFFCTQLKRLFPETTIKYNGDLECGHILWPEIMFPSNKALYKKYQEKLNPALLTQPKANRKEFADIFRMEIQAIHDAEKAKDGRIPYFKLLAEDTRKMKVKVHR